MLAAWATIEVDSANAKTARTTLRRVVIKEWSNHQHSLCGLTKGGDKLGAPRWRGLGLVTFF